MTLLQGLLDSFVTAIAKVRALDELNNPTDSGLAMTVKVNTASQKAIQKLERKAQRRGKAGTAAVADIDYARTVGWAALQVCAMADWWLHPWLRICRFKRTGEVSSVAAGHGGGLLEPDQHWWRQHCCR